MNTLENTTEQKIKEIISKILNISINEITDNSSPRSIPTWKGKNHRKITKELEKEFQITFDRSEVETLVSYKIIKATIMAYIN